MPRSPVCVDAIQAALSMKVTFLNPPNLSQQAFELAARFNRPAVYDSYYLALADQLQCLFWTADERLYNAIHEDYPLIRWLGHYQPET